MIKCGFVAWTALLAVAIGYTVAIVFVCGG